MRKRRAAAAAPDTRQGARFLFAHAGADLVERRALIARPFPRVLTLGAPEETAELRAGAAFAMAGEIEATSGADFLFAPDALPFAEGRFDLICAPLSLAWANDLPGALIQARRALAPDGLLLATLYGPETLKELRAVLLEAEAETTGGASLRIAPFVEVRDAAALAQRAGLALPAADRDVLTVRYSHPFRLLQDLRAMGETAALAGPLKPLRRDSLMRAMALYQQRFSDPDGRVRASFELVTLAGWAPHASQQQPLRPGSAKARLADALGVKEHTAGEKAGE